MSITPFTQINTLKITRTFCLNIIKDLTVDQLNKVPAGYNNNIIWNIAHMIAAQEGVCYLRAGKSTNISEAFYNSYKPGSKPEAEVTAGDIDTIKSLLLGSFDQLEKDLQTNHFENYMPWATRYGVEMKSIHDAVNFLPFHDGMHMGYIMALKRLV
ncbi:DinB family protein [Pedobacter metabolipauper]|uniref:DinB family protein n=1 Tax=Pedobacter metabolipauper TaxID=425513 RepID=A0A4R6SZH6_9SPHI|nr:DinB family protein [Pedobacter metabolipauper]TDQ11455.1 DinB family protein [Pedobacter metabolipauper]